LTIILLLLGDNFFCFKNSCCFSSLSNSITQRIWYFIANSTYIQLGCIYLSVSKISPCTTQWILDRVCVSIISNNQNILVDFCLVSCIWSTFIAHILCNNRCILFIFFHKVISQSWEVDLNCDRLVEYCIIQCLTARSLFISSDVKSRKWFLSNRTHFFSTNVV